MAKMCQQCGREKHKGLCDLVELSDGRFVHASRIDEGGDLHDKVGVEFEVINRWIKKNLLRES